MFEKKADVVRCYAGPPVETSGYKMFDVIGCTPLGIPFFAIQTFPIFKTTRSHAKKISSSMEITY